MKYLILLGLIYVVFHWKWRPVNGRDNLDEGVETTDFEEIESILHQGENKHPL